MPAITSGVFFHRLASGARLADAVDRDILIQQLPAAAGDVFADRSQKLRPACCRRRGQVSWIPDRRTSGAVSRPQTVEQDDGGFHLIGRQFQMSGIHNRGNGWVTTSQTLALPDGWIGGSIDKQAGDQFRGDPLLLDKMA